MYGLIDEPGALKLGAHHLYRLIKDIDYVPITGHKHRLHSICDETSTSYMPARAVLAQEPVR